MTDLANLGIRVESQEVETAENRLNDLSNAANRAETSNERLANAARGSAAAEREAALAAAQQQREVIRLLGSVDPLEAAIRGVNQELALASRLYEAGAIDAAMFARAQAVLTTRLEGLRERQAGYRREMGLSRHEALNLGRQFSDVAVSLASGMPFYLIAIQQGAQIGEVFAEARTRGVGFDGALRSLARTLAPVARLLGLVGAAVGAVAVAFGLLHRSIHGTDLEDLTRGLGLTEEQLEKVERRTVSMGDTFRAVLSVIKEDIMNGPIGEALDWMGTAWENGLDHASDLLFDWLSNVLAAFPTATTVAVRAVLRLPAAAGEAMANIANAALSGIEMLVRKTLESINWAISQINRIPGINIGLMGTTFSLGRIEAEGGGIEALQEVFDADNIMAMFGAFDAAVENGMRAWGERVAERAREFRRNQIREEAGEPRSGGSGADRVDREMERRIRESQRFLDALRQETAEIGLNAIQIRLLAIEAAAAEAPTAQLAAAIRRAGEDWHAATMAFERRQTIEAIEANIVALAEEAEMMELERELIGASSAERARQLAMLAAEIELRRQAREHFRTTGEKINLVDTPEGQRYIAAVGQNAVDAAAMADMRALHDALASTFSSALTHAVRGDWRGALQSVLQTIFNNVLDSMAQDLAAVFSGRSKGGGGWFQEALGFFFGGSSGSIASPNKEGAPSAAGALAAPSKFPGLEQSASAMDLGKLVIEFREGQGFGGKVLEYAGPAIIEAATQSVKGGSMQAQADLSKRARRRLGAN